MKRANGRRGIGLAVAAALLAGAGTTRAQTSGRWSVDAGGTWSTPGNWTIDGGVGSYPEGIGASARLTNDLTAARTVTQDVSVTLGSLTIGDAVGSGAGAYTLTNSSGCTITLDSGGAGPVAITKVTTSTARTTDTMYPDVILATNLSLTVNGSGAGFNFNMYGAISGANRTVTIAGNYGTSGPHLRSTNSSYSGRTIINDSVSVTIYSLANVGGGNSSLGAPATVADGTIQFGSGAGNCRLEYGGSGTFSSDRTLNIVGAAGAVRNLAVSGSGRLTLTTPFTFSAGEFTGNLALNPAGGSGTLVILGAITNRALTVGFGVTTGGAGPAYLLGLNTYTNATTINRGMLVINSIADANGTPSSLGAPETEAKGTVAMNAVATVDSVLRYIGIGHSSSRAFALTSGTGPYTLDASGYGKLTLSGVVTNSGASIKNLYLSGTGEGEVSGVICDYGGANLTTLTKSGAGTWKVSGDNKFTGAATLNGAAGRLILGHANALGLGTNAIALAAGTLDPGDADRTIANAITLSDHTIAGSSHMTFNGTLTASGANRSLTSSLDAGKTLAVTNAVLSHTSATTFSLLGTGDTAINGVISESGAGAKGLFLRNRGTTTISGTNAYTGQTAMFGGGTVILDYGAAGGDGSKLPDGAKLTLSGGSDGASAFGGTDLILKGGTHTEVVSGTDIGGGTAPRGHVNVMRQGGSATLQMNTITFRGDTINFSEDGIATTDSGNTQQLLGGWPYATVGGTDWACNSTGGADGPITKLPPEGYVNLPTSGGIGTSNYILSGSATLTGDLDVFTLKIVPTADAQTLTLGTYNLSRCNGLLYAGGPGTNYTISGSTGYIFYYGQGHTIYVRNGTLTVDAPMSTGSGAWFYKTGPGRLVLNKASTFGSTFAIYEGAVRIKNGAALGMAGTGTIMAASPFGSALELDGGITVAGEALDLQGNGISSGGVLRNISGDNTWGGTITIQYQGARINSDADTLTITNGIITSAGNDVTFGGPGNITITNGVISGAGAVTKDGAGTLTLASANTYTGPTAVNAGTLKLTGSIAAGSKVTVNSGATLCGAGACLGEVWVRSNGTIRAEGGNLTVGNLALFVGSTNVFNGADRIVVANAGDIANQTGLTIMQGAQVRLTGNLIAGTHDIIRYSGQLNGSPTNLIVSNPVGGVIYSFSNTTTAVTLLVTQRSGTLFTVW